MKKGNLYEDGRSRLQEFLPLPEKRPNTTINVYQDVVNGEWTKSKVDWSAIAGQHSEDAKAFAKTLLEAVKLAEKWDKEKGLE